LDRDNFVDAEQIVSQYTLVNSPQCQCFTDGCKCLQWNVCSRDPTEPLWNDMLVKLLRTS